VHAVASFIEDVSVDHRGADVFVAKKFLDGPDIVSCFEQVGGEGVPEGMAADMFDNSSFSDSFFYCPLEDCFMNVVPPFLSRLCVYPTVLLREDPLLAPFGGRVRVFAVKRVRQPNAPPALFEIFFVGCMDFSQVFLKVLFQRFGQHGDQVISALAVADRDLVSTEINIFDAQPQTLH
jgi:hypothetical protein